MKSYDNFRQYWDAEKLAKNRFFWKNLQTFLLTSALNFDRITTFGGRKLLNFFRRFRLKYQFFDLNILKAKFRYYYICWFLKKPYSPYMDHIKAMLMIFQKPFSTFYPADLFNNRGSLSIYNPVLKCLIWTFAVVVFTMSVLVLKYRFWHKTRSKSICVFFEKIYQILTATPAVHSGRIRTLGTESCIFQISIAPVRCFIFSWVTRVFFKDNFQNFYNLHNNLFALYFITKVASFVVFILQFFHIEQFFAIVFRYNVVFFLLNFFRKNISIYYECFIFAVCWSFYLWFWNFLLLWFLTKLHFCKCIFLLFHS